MRFALPLTFVLSLGACSGEEPPPAAPGGPGYGGGVGVPGGSDAGSEDAAVDGGFATCQRLDLLFVVDNSVSMVEEQAALGARAGWILDVLEDESAPVDYHLGVVHSAWGNPAVYGFVSPASEGALLQGAGMAQPWIERDYVARESVLSAMLSAGGEGFDEDAHLAVARSALIELTGTGPNRDFVREDAALGIVVVTDTDDQSLEGGNQAAIDAVLAAFDDLKGDPAAWSVAVIAGAREPRCTSDLLGEASYAAGLAELTAQAGSGSGLFSLCSGDLRPALRDALASVLQQCAQYQASESP